MCKVLSCRLLNGLLVIVKPWQPSRAGHLWPTFYVLSCCLWSVSRKQDFIMKAPLSPAAKRVPWRSLVRCAGGPKEATCSYKDTTLVWIPLQNLVRHWRNMPLPDFCSATTVKIYSVNLGRETTFLTLPQGRRDRGWRALGWGTRGVVGRCVLSPWLRRVLSASAPPYASIAGGLAWLLFSLLGCSGRRLQLHPSEWPEDEEYTRMAKVVTQLAVVNDAAKPGVKDCPEYAAQDGTQGGRIIAVASSHRATAPIEIYT